MYTELDAKNDDLKIILTVQAKFSQITAPIHLQDSSLAYIKVATFMFKALQLPTTIS